MMMKQKTALLAMALALAGCNAEDDKSSPQATPPPPTASVSKTPSIIANAIIGEVKHIPIYQSVQARNGQLLSISSVRQLSSESTAELCPEPKINGLELIYTQDTAGVCSYEYSVTDNTTDSTTTARLISSASSGTAKLADITSVTVMGTDKTENITVAEGDTITIVTVLGAGTAIANSNNIVFTPGNTGLARIVYAVNNDSGATPTSKIGVINVTVSELDDGNTVPVTPDMSFTALPGETKTLTLGITDADVGDNPQLIGVTSTDGVTAAPEATDIDADYFTNKNFTFTAALPGNYTVFYTAHDHRGGYNTGRASITVAGDVGLIARDASFYRAPSQLAYDFKIDLRSYITAPDLTKVEYVGAVFDDATSSTIDKNPAYITAPTKATPELTYRYKGANSTGLVAIKYTVKNGAGRTSGRVFINIGATRPIITTVGPTTDVVYGATVTATSACTDCVQAKTEYTWTYAGDTIKANTFKVPDGVAGESLILEATPYGVSGEKGVSKSVTYSYPLIKMISSVIKDNAKADNLDTNHVLITLIKADGKPLVGQEVTATVYPPTASLLTSSKNTNVNGEVLFNIRSSTGGEVALTATAAPSAYKRVSAIVSSRFLVPAPRYCHQYPGIADLNCLPYVTVANGKTYTASISFPYLEGGDIRPSAGIIVYAGVAAETGEKGEAGDYVLFDYNNQRNICGEMYYSDTLGRSNWRQPSLTELREDLFNAYGNMFEAHKWPVSYPYWSADDLLGSSGELRLQINLETGSESGWYNEYDAIGYAVCVSDPVGF